MRSSTYLSHYLYLLSKINPIHSLPSSLCFGEKTLLLEPYHVLDLKLNEHQTEQKRIFQIPCAMLSDRNQLASFLPPWPLGAYDHNYQTPEQPSPDSFA